MANGYRDALVQQIKDAFEQHEVPTIDYTTSVVNKVACDRVIYQKGESNVSKI